MTIIKTHNSDGISNIEKITKYCGKLRAIFNYPYFFHWTFPTNFIDDSISGKMEDSVYFCFHVGRYPTLPEVVGQAIPVSKEIIFAPCDTIVENGRWVSYLMEKIDSNFSLKDITNKKKKIKKNIDDYLQKELIESANISISSYNKFHPNQDPIPLLTMKGL
jgi:hypothetical protein